MIQPSGYPTPNISNGTHYLPSKSVLGGRVQSPKPVPMLSLSYSSPHASSPPIHLPLVHRAIFTERKDYIIFQLKNLSVLTRPHRE